MLLVQKVSPLIDRRLACKQQVNANDSQQDEIR